MSEFDDEELDEDPYTTVTNGERFAPLHTAVLALFADLGLRYDVAVSQAFEQTPSLSAFEHTRPPITLLPAGGGAPLAVAFPSDISLALRCGWWHADVFPSCTCDGCGLTLAHEAERFADMCFAVVAGGFQEALSTVPVLDGMAQLSHTFTGPSGIRSGGTTLRPATAVQLLGTRPAESMWKPWAPRVRVAGIRAPG